MPAVPTLVAHASARAANATDTSISVTLDTTNANFILVAVGGFTSVVAPTDNKGNVYSTTSGAALVGRLYFDSCNAAATQFVGSFYFTAPVVGIGHTITYTDTIGPGHDLSIAVLAFSGIQPTTASFDTRGSFSDNAATPLTFPSGTPGAAGELFLMLYCDTSNMASLAISGGFIIAEKVGASPTNSSGIAVAYLVQQGAAAAVSPTWSGGAATAGANNGIFKRSGVLNIATSMNASMATSGGAVSTKRIRSTALTASAATMSGAMKRGRLFTASAATMAGAILRGRLLTASAATMAGALSRRAVRLLTASMATMSATVMRGRMIGASLMTFAGGIANRTGKSLTASMATFAGALARLQGRALAASMATMSAILGRAKAGTQAFSASMATMSATLLRGRLFVASMATMAATAVRTTRRSLPAASMATFSAALSAAKAGGVILTASMATFSGSIVKMTKKVFNAS